MMLASASAAGCEVDLPNYRLFARHVSCAANRGGDINSGLDPNVECAPATALEEENRHLDPRISSPRMQVAREQQQIGATKAYTSLRSSLVSHHLSRATILEPTAALAQVAQTTLNRSRSLSDLGQLHPRNDFCGSGTVRCDDTLGSSTMLEHGVARIRDEKDPLAVTPPKERGSDDSEDDEFDHHTYSTCRATESREPEFTHPHNDFTSSVASAGLGGPALRAVLASCQAREASAAASKGDGFGAPPGGACPGGSGHMGAHAEPPSRPGGLGSQAGDAWQVRAYGRNSDTVLPTPAIAVEGHWASGAGVRPRGAGKVLGQLPRSLEMNIRKARGAVGAGGRPLSVPGEHPTSFRSLWREADVLAAQEEGEGVARPPERPTHLSYSRSRTKAVPDAERGAHAFKGAQRRRDWL